MGDKCLEINYEVTEWFTARKRCLTYEKKDMWVVKNAKELNNIKYSINFSEKVVRQVSLLYTNQKGHLLKICLELLRYI